MSLLSFQFLFIIIVSLIVRALKLPSAAKKTALFILSIIFAESFLSSADCILLFVFVITGYFYIKLLLNYKNINTILVLFFYSSLILFYLILKGHVFNLVSPAIELTGLSYIIFRIIHLMVYVSEEKPVKLTFFDYLLFLFSFPHFISGPVQNYQEFTRSLRDEFDENTANWESIFFRMSWGFIKIFFLSYFFTNTANLLLNTKSESNELIFELLISSIAYVFAIYLNFSGYMDIMISTAKIWGIKLPENFNEPFLAEDFMDFWRRWHITVSNWFKDYVFTPFFKLTITKLKIRNIIGHTFLAVFCLSISFFIMGLWHGIGLHFAIHGLLLAIGVSFNVLKNFYSRNRNSSFPHRSWLRRLLSRALTLAYFTFCLLWFKYDYLFLNSTIWKNLNLSQTFLYLIFLFLIWIIIHTLYDLIKLFYSILSEGWLRIAPNFRIVLMPIFISFFIYTCILFSLQQNYIPMDIIYRRF
jgi:alginate O-acetyltransferase complex protein AlgI